MLAANCSVLDAWKVNVKLFLCFFFLLSNTPWGRIGGMEVEFHTLLTSALDESEWSASRPSCFIPGKGGSLKLIWINLSFLLLFFNVSYILFSDFHE
jgi:hypothetical protein